MQRLSTIIKENLVQPDDIGQQTDGLFRMIELGTQLSIIEQDANKKRRLEENINSLKAKLEQVSKRE